MRVAHVCLSNLFADGFGYQENELVKAHLRQGHEVTVLCSTETFSSAGKLAYLPPGDYVGKEGARVVRLPYVAWLPHRIAIKVRAVVGVYDRLVELNPDAVMFHGTCGWEIGTVARYVEDHPEVIAYLDSHSDSYNSARGFFSRWFLHGIFYKFLIARNVHKYRKVLCISKEVMDFAERVHGIERDRLEFFPLGGQILEDDEYQVRRAQQRAKLGVENSDIVFAVTGRLSKRKRLVDALKAFSVVGSPRFKIFIAGVIDADVREEVTGFIEADSRIRLLGWRDARQLTDLLCAADVYLQPGTQSATMQHSLCCRCAIILKNYPSHFPFFSGNGWLFSDFEGLVAALKEVEGSDLHAMSNNSYVVARDLLNYDAMALRVLS